MAEKGKNQQREREYGTDNLSRQRQSEGTPRPFDNATAREESRNIVGRVHFSEIDKGRGGDHDDFDTLEEGDYDDFDDEE